MGPAVELSEAGDAEPAFVGPLGASAHRGGAIVAYRIRTAFLGREEARLVEIDARGRPRGPTHTIVSTPGRAAGLSIEPRATSGCEVAALFGIETLSMELEGPSWCRLAILRDDASRPDVFDVGESAMCWDLRREGELLTWLQLDSSLAPLQIMRADRTGTVIGSLGLDRQVGLSIGSARRIFLSGGRFAFVSRMDGRAELVVFDTDGNTLAVAPFGPAPVRAAPVVKDGETWLIWSHDGGAGDVTLSGARLTDDGELRDRITFGPLDDAQPGAAHAWVPAWIGGAWLIPLYADGRAYVGVFEPSGALSNLLALPNELRDAEIIPTESGALLVYVESRYADPPLPSSPRRLVDTVLMARPIRCVH